MLVVLVLGSACAGAEPTETLVRPEGSPVALSVPVEYQETPTDLEGVSGLDLTRPDGAAGETRPLGRILHRRLPRDVVEGLSRRDLRLFGEGLDPLVVSQTQPGSLQVLDYEEIDDEDWWGSRIRVVAPREPGDDVVVDRLVLVGRADGDLVEAEFTCSTGCFGTYQDEIDEILTSWTTEDGP